MGTLKDRLNNSGYKAWLSGGLVLKYLKNGIANYLDIEVQSLHTSILNNIHTGLPPGVTVSCVTGCTTLLAKQRHWTCGSHNICTDFNAALESHHTMGRLMLANTDVSLWTNRAKHWETGKCFMSPGYADKQTAQEIDCSGLLGLIINCKVVHQKFSPTLIHPVDTFEQVRDFRNEKIMHNANLTLLQADLGDLITSSLAILNDPVLLTNPKSIEAAKQINEIKNTQFTFTLDDELQVLGDAVKALEGKQVQHEDRVQQTIENHKAAIENEMKMNMASLNTKTKEGIDTLKKDMDAQKDLLQIEMKQVKDTLTKINGCIGQENDKTRTLKMDMEDVRKKNEDLRTTIQSQRQWMEDVIFKIKTKHQDLGAKESKKRREITQKDTASLQQHLKDMYADYVDLVPVSPLSRDEGLPIHQIFTPVIVKEDISKGRHKPDSSNLKPVTTYRELLYQDGKIAKQTFMIGSAGRGKSTYCLRMLDDWRNCKIKQTLHDTSDGERDMLGFEYVFFISLRNVDKADKSIVDMICNQLFFEHPKYRATAMHVLETTPNKCLVILDGLDEWSPSPEACFKLMEPGLPNRDKLYDCATFITSRPWKLEALRPKLNKSDKIVHIKGIGEKDVKSLIRKVLINYCKVPKESETFPQKLMNF